MADQTTGRTRPMMLARAVQWSVTLSLLIGGSFAAWPFFVPAPGAYYPERELKVGTSVRTQADVAFRIHAVPQSGQGSSVPPTTKSEQTVRVSWEPKSSLQLAEREESQLAFPFEQPYWEAGPLPRLTVIRIESIPDLHRVYIEIVDVRPVYRRVYFGSPAEIDGTPLQRR